MEYEVVDDNCQHLKMQSWWQKVDSERGGLMRMKRMGGEGVFYKFLINIIPIEDMMKDVL